MTPRTRTKIDGIGIVMMVMLLVWMLRAPHALEKLTGLDEAAIVAAFLILFALAPTVRFGQFKHRPWFACFFMLLLCPIWWYASWRLSLGFLHSAVVTALIVVIALFPPVESLKHQGRVPWLSPALFSAFFATELIFFAAWLKPTWMRTIAIVVCAFLSVLLAVGAVTALLEQKKRCEKG
jgi:hypothetical protein